MKKSALVAAVAALMASTPAMANGYVGAVYGNTDLGGGDLDTWQVEGAFGHNAGAWGFQGDGSIGNSDGGGGDLDHWTLAGHLYWGGAGWRIGGVIATSQLDGGGGADVEELVYGVETSFDISPNSVILASATFGEVDFLGTDIDTWNIDGAWNFYTAPNFRFGLALGVGNLDAGGVDADTFTGGVNAEWAPFTTVPISFTAGWNHFDDDNTLVGETDTLSIGARWNFGGGSLRDRDNATPFDTRTGLYSRVLDLR